MPTIVGNKQGPFVSAYNQTGVFQVTGTTKNKALPTNVPVYRRVRLHNQFTGRILAEEWSDPTTGAYAFKYIPPGTYFVVAFDHTGTYNGVVETDVVAEPIP